MKKRLLASFLSLVLILGLLPTAALATDATSGTCGATGNESSVTWKLVQNSTGSDPATTLSTSRAPGRCKAMQRTQIVVRSHPGRIIMQE